MLKPSKQFLLSDIGPLYFASVILLIILTLSLFEYNPGFIQRTSLARLYENKIVTAGLLLIFAIGLIKLHTAKVEERRTASLVFAGVLWGLSLASAFAFDIGIFLTLSLAASNLYRENRHA